MRVVDIGAGESPHPDATETLDIREDLEHIDHSGVDIAQDTLPFDDESVDRILMMDIVEHIPGHRLTHVWQEVDRVLRPGGQLEVRLPHSGTWAAMTDPTHQGTGGTTPDIDNYFDSGSRGYWADLGWQVDSYAILEWPTVVRRSLRLTGHYERGELTAELVKIPGVTGYVHLQATVTEQSD